MYMYIAGLRVVSEPNMNVPTCTCTCTCMMYMHDVHLLPGWRCLACLATSTRKAASCAGNSCSVSSSPGLSSSARSSRASSRRARCVLCACLVRTVCVPRAYTDVLQRMRHIGGCAAEQVCVYMYCLYSGGIEVASNHDMLYYFPPPATLTPTQPLADATLLFIDRSHHQNIYC